MRSFIVGVVVCVCCLWSTVQHASADLIGSGVRFDGSFMKNQLILINNLTIDLGQNELAGEKTPEEWMKLTTTTGDANTFQFIVTGGEVKNDRQIPIKGTFVSTETKTEGTTTIEIKEQLWDFEMLMSMKNNVPKDEFYQDEMFMSNVKIKKSTKTFWTKDTTFAIEQQKQSEKKPLDFHYDSTDFPYVFIRDPELSGVYSYDTWLGSKYHNLMSWNFSFIVDYDDKAAVNNPAPTPEPATWIMGLTGVAAVIGSQVWRSRRTKQSV